MDKKKYNQPGQTPPKWADRFLEWYCSPTLLDEVQGDLYEVFSLRVKKFGPRKARLLYIKEVFLFCKPAYFKSPSKQKYVSNMPGLFHNYFKIALRNTLNSKLFSSINIVGLAIGLATCFLIMQYVLYEESYDSYHINGDNIYRVNLDNGEGPVASNHPGSGPSLKDDYPEVVEYARMVPQAIFVGDVTAWSYVTEDGEAKVFNEEKVYNVDPSFLTMFSFPFIHGDPKSALNDARSVVISKKVAEKFFGNETPLGKTLSVNGDNPFNVTGVFEDIPENSHLKFDILVSSFTRDGNANKHLGWRWPEFYTYIQLAPGTDPAQLQKKLPAFVTKYLGDVVQEYKWDITFSLQPLKDIYLNSTHIAKQREVPGNKRTNYFLTLIAIIIMVIAWINYINLSTSKSIERAQEVGLRKVSGASRKQLILQFLLESSIINFLSILLAFGLIVLSYPFFIQLIGKNIAPSVWELPILTEASFWLLLLVIFIIGSFLSGLYPAFILSSFKVTSVLKGKFSRSTSGVIFRKILVAIQFIISVGLIAGTFIVSKQVSFMRSQELGYQKDQLLVIKSPSVYDSTFTDRLNTFKVELVRNSNINNIAPSSEIPGKMITNLNGLRKLNESLSSNTLGYQVFVDKDFMDTYGFDIMAGRNFRENESLLVINNTKVETVPIIINEIMMDSLGFENPEEATNKLVNFGFRDSENWVGEIIGVVNNHHQRSLKQGYDPIVFFPIPGLNGSYYTVNLNMTDTGNTITYIEDRYKKAFPGNQFEYFFLDDYFDRQYAADQQFGNVFGSFSSLALIVACLGLFGLSTFTVSQRKKEMIIRKVLGATFSNVVLLFSKDFVKLIVAANFLALPAVYFIVRHWLQNFAFQVNIGWVIFILPAAILLIISLTTVFFQTLKTEKVNPINSLRKE